MSFFALQVSFERINYTFAEKADKLFWTKQKEKTFAVEEKKWEHREVRKTLCCHRPKTLIALVFQQYRVLIGRIHSLYNTLTYRL